MSEAAKIIPINFSTEMSKTKFFPVSIVSIESSVIEVSSSEKFLTIASNFTFEKHIIKLCRKINLKNTKFTKFT